MAAHSDTDEPITFREPSWLLFDVDRNAVLMTEHGNLAIFNTEAMAKYWAERSAKNLEVRAVYVTLVAGAKQ